MNRLSGESERAFITEKHPFLLSGTKVQDGQGKMLVTTVGMRTEWGKLQVKLNGVTTIIGKIGLFFAIVTFLVLTARFLVEKALHGEFGNWSSNDATNGGGD